MNMCVFTKCLLRILYMLTLSRIPHFVCSQFCATGIGCLKKCLGFKNDIRSPSTLAGAIIKNKELNASKNAPGKLKSKPERSRANNL